MIEVKHLVKKYADKVAVNDLSFSVREGEVLGFLGPNGAGKSTTMNILTGYLAATSGEVLIQGIDLSENPEEAKKCIGYLPELPPLYTDMTVEEYLRFMYRLKRVPKSINREAHIAEICDQVYLRDVKKRLIRNLSKGYRQRVGIAQAMIGNPKILILDEPTVGLDPKQIIEVRELILELKKNHTIVLSSHILQEIQAVCTRSLIINEGRLITDNINLEQEKNQYFLALVEGAKEEVLAKLRHLPGVLEVRYMGAAAPQVGSYQLQTTAEIPVRRAIFDLVCANGWRLLGLEQKEETLETVYIRATTGNKMQEEKENEVV